MAIGRTLICHFGNVRLCSITVMAAGEDKRRPHFGARYLWQVGKDYAPSYSLVAEIRFCLNEKRVILGPMFGKRGTFSLSLTDRFHAKDPAVTSRACLAAKSERQGPRGYCLRRQDLIC